MKLKLLILFFFSSIAMLHASPEMRKATQRERSFARVEVSTKITRTAKNAFGDDENKISMEQALKNQNLFFPNPAKDFLNVDNSLLFFEKVEVYNIIGTVVLSAEISSTKEVRLNVANLERGSYFIRFFSKDNQMVFRKISLI
jgi:hypothetical protein